MATKNNQKSDAILVLFNPYLAGEEIGFFINYYVIYWPRFAAKTLLHVFIQLQELEHENGEF